MSNKLFSGSDVSEDEEISLGTNKEYAKSYNKLRQKELLKKFQDRDFAASDSESSSESESSDEDEVLDPKFDQEFFKTLASLKSKDPAIYDKNTKFFEGLSKDEGNFEDSENENKPSDDIGKAHRQKKLKPVTLKDYERKIILERDGKFEDDSDAEDLTENLRPASPSAVEAERRLRAEFSKVVNAKEDSEDEGFGGIFKKRVKTTEESAKEEEDFVQWLAGKKEDIKNDVKQILEPLKNYWNNSKLPQSERFLRDYILNKGYAETNFADIPTYDEIVGDTAPLSEDEAELEKQAEFEHKYNFRFEEPDAEFITRYPRTIENSVRRTDDKRKQKRQEIKERKKEEKQQKMKELEIVKEMKRKEIEEKIRKLKMVTGNDELGFRDDELEEDFDPEAHDRRMQEIFNDDYYQVNEGEEKPECPSDIDELQIEDWDNYDPRKENDGADDFAGCEPHCEDDNFNMDCDYDPLANREQLQKELIESTRGRKNRKGRKSRFMEMIKKEKPAFNNEDEKTYAEYIEEYYKMDCEDIIGDIPCRFKYVETTPNDFGLTIEEILLAKNKELNQWASLKKAIQIRPDHVEKKEQRLYKLKAKNEDLKRKIFKSLYGEESDEDRDHEEDAGKTEALNEVKGKTEQKNTSSDGEKSKKKRKRKAQTTSTAACDMNITDTNKNIGQSNMAEKKPKLDVENTLEKSTPIAILNTVNSGNTSNKKNKKRKNNSNQKRNATITTITETDPKLKTANTNNSLNTVPPNDDTKPIPRNLSMVNSSKNVKEISCKNPFNTNNKDKQFNTNIGLKSEKGKSSKSLKKAGGATGKLKNKLKFNKKRDSNETSNVKISDDRLKAYGINPNKFHKKIKYGKNKQKA